MSSQNIVKIKLFFIACSINFLFIQADGWQKVIKPMEVPKSAEKKTIEKPKKIEAPTTLPVTAKEKTQKKVASDKVASDSVFKRFKNFVFGFEKTTKKPDEQKAIAKQIVSETSRKAKIAHGTKFVSTLAKNPKKIIEMLPKRPPDLDRLLDPEKCKNITPAQLRKMQNDPEIQRYLKEYLFAVEAIGEHFFAVAKQKAPDYKSGTIVIEDKNGKLHEFLHSYVEMTSKLSKGPQTDVEKPAIVAESNAYARRSSHFGKNYKYGSQESKDAGKPSHYGIDLDNPIKTSTFEKPDPEDVRSHFLFGKIEVDRPFMFIKFETHGLGGAKEAAIHTVNYVRRIGSMVVEKTASDKPEDSSKFTVKDRRENTPKVILQEYKKLLQTSGLSKKDQNRLLDEAISCGISSILRQIKGKEQFKAFEEKIRKTYSNKTYGDGSLDIRMGNEIIIRDKDLQQF